MKNLILITLIFLCLKSYALELSDNQLSFSYIPNDDGSGGAMTCKHERIRDLPDWKVTCGQKEFAAHVVLREYQRNSEPRTGIEILYLVTDRNFKSPLFTTGTSWINLKKPTSLHSLNLTQSVENDYASLQIEWHP